MVSQRRGMNIPFSSRSRRSELPKPLVRPKESSTPQSSSMVDSAIYQRGVRVASPETLAQTYQALDQVEDGVAWIGLYRPSEQELMSLAEEFNLHPLSIEDAIVAHQRPKLERYDKALFIVLKAANYLDVPEEVDFGELHLFIGSNFVVTVRHSESPNLAQIRQGMEEDPEFLNLGPQAVLYSIIDTVVDAYTPVVEGLENDIDEIETQVFGGEALVSRRIYELSREVIEFQRATQPLSAVVSALEKGSSKYGVSQELQRRLRDVADHLTLVNERVEGFRYLLRDILTVNSTLVSERQNEELTRLAHSSNSQGEEVKKISSWAAILFAPSLIAGVYGMNFEVMPELEWAFGYPMALMAMLALSGVLYIVFKKRNWL